MPSRYPAVPTLLILIAATAGVVGAFARSAVLSLLLIPAVFWLAYDLDERVVVKGEARSGESVPVAGFSGIFLLAPSADLRVAFSADYDSMPVLDTCQRYRAVPKPSAVGS